jgi:predicted RNase H-like HicB family nuclease
MRSVVVNPGEIGYWVAECPRCVLHGKTKKEAIQNIRQAIAGYVLAVPPYNGDAVLVAV